MISYNFLAALFLQILFHSQTFSAPAPDPAAAPDTTTTPTTTSTIDPAPLVHPLQTVFRQYLEERQNVASRGTFGSGYRVNRTTTCHRVLSHDLVKEIAGHKETVQKILDATLRGSFRGKAWEELALFVDLFGHRLPGSEVMEKTMSFLGERMADMGLSNLHEEEIKIPLWSRGIEVAHLTIPVEQALNIRGMGLSVETPPDGITAEVVVLQSFQEMEDKKENLKGKIVVFNSDFGESELHVMFGPSMVGQYGAAGVLCRSPTRLVTSSVVIYEPNGTNIPAAIISQDDADMITRMAGREDDVTIHFRMINQVHAERSSRNIFGDFPGNDEEGLVGGADGNETKEILMIISHAASWDVGEGAQDDGVGIILEMLTTALFKHLEIKPKRTIRSAIFTAEESGLVGATKWVADHKDELPGYTAVLEADMGCFKASGFVVSGSKEATCMVAEIMKLFQEETNATLLAKMEAIPSNVMSIHGEGVPTISLIGDDEKSRFFETQHTFMDSMSSVNPDELDKCLAVMASTAFVLANIKDKLPRKE